MWLGVQNRGYSAPSGALSAAGVVGTIIPDGQVTIASDGSANFGAQGPSNTVLYDDGRNYAAVGSTITVTDPVIGSWSSQDLEGLVSASGRNQINSKGLLTTYITQTERNANGGARQNAVLLGAAYTELYCSRALRFVQAGTYSGSFWKMLWLFDSTNVNSTSGVWDIVLPTFNSGINGVAFAGNNNGGSLNFGSSGGDPGVPPFSWSSYVDTSGGWNIIETWLKLGATSASDKGQLRWTSSLGVYDSGVQTKAMSTLGTRQFQALNFPGWNADTGGDPRVQGPNEVAATEFYLTAGPGAAARVGIGNASTLASCTDLTFCTIDSWSNTSIAAKLRQGGFPTLSGKYIFVLDANGSIVSYSGAQGRLIS